MYLIIMSQNYFLSFNNINNYSYDYILNLNMTAFPSFTSSNSLFNNRRYFLDISGNIKSDIILNQAFITNLLTYDYAKLKKNGLIKFDVSNNNLLTNDFYSKVNLNPEKFGPRILEILAYKIFDDPTSDVFIDNSYDFYKTSDDSFINVVVSKMSNDINNLQLNIYNQYLNTPQYTPISNTPTLYNFQNSVWFYPIFYSDNLYYSNGDIASSFNGPVVEGNDIVNGNFNIPLLLKLWRN